MIQAGPRIDAGPRIQAGGLIQTGGFYPKFYGTAKNALRKRISYPKLSSIDVVEVS